MVWYDVKIYIYIKKKIMSMKELTLWWIYIFMNENVNTNVFGIVIKSVFIVSKKNDWNQIFFLSLCMW